MYCAIQKLTRKRPDPYGGYKEIKAYPLEMSINGVEQVPIWRWEWTGGRFERPHLEAYKISLHQSFREGGKVKKRQFSVCTMSWYNIIDVWWGDCVLGGEDAIVEKTGLDAAEINRLIDAKLDPLRERILAEYDKSPEHLAHLEHRRILDTHEKARARFCERYGVDSDEYSKCYDVFGVLRNEEYLEKIKAEHKARKSSYRQYTGSNYSGWSSGSYSLSSASTYTEDETGILRQFYKTLAKKYHPDLNPERDTTKEMQLLNRIKDEWNV